jgi:hypothetical protein
MNNWQSLKRWIKDHILTQENLWAVLLFVLITLLVIFSADRSPLWIYQGF